MGEYCFKCGKLAVHNYDGNDYCIDCYNLEEFGCNDIIAYLIKKKIRYTEHSIPGVILTKKSHSLLRFLDAYEYEYCESKNNPGTLCIEVK